jgi:hypothetical protein
MTKSEKWHCANPTCQKEIIVTRSSGLENTQNPRCGCGSAMKKEYEKPMLRKAMGVGGRSR